MNTRSKLPLGRTQSDEYGRRSRLVSLAYEVLREMKTPVAEATTTAMSSDLSRAFFEKATVLANHKPAAPMARVPKAPSHKPDNSAP
jgi:hypothetical protein